MPTKHDDPTIKKIGDDEPIFVLRAQDALAPVTIAHWIYRATNSGVPIAKLESAHRYLAEIEAWQFAHPDRVKNPD